jgi:hypothetical protein
MAHIADSAIAQSTDTLLGGDFQIILRMLLGDYLG